MAWLSILSMALQVILFFVTKARKSLARSKDDRSVLDGLEHEIRVYRFRILDRIRRRRQRG